MLRINQNTSADGTHKYFFGYYAEQELDQSKWYGKAAEKLELSGEINEKDFKALCHNLNPQTKEQLTARNAEHRTVGYDFTFSVPKSVSIIYSLTQDKDILTGFHNAVAKTMEEIETSAETRVRGKGKSENRTTGNLVWGTFTHGESRPVEGIPDPHLHKHVFVFNATYDQKEEKWKAGQFRNLKANAPYYETKFRSRFADELKQIGYDIERNKKDFEVKGFDRDLIKKYSNRTVQIDERASELGITYKEDKAALGAKTRVQKRKDIDRNELRKKWESRLTNKEMALVFKAKKYPFNTDRKEISAKAALEYSLDHNLERKSTVSEKEIQIHALIRSYGSVTPKELDRALAKRKGLMSKKDNYGNRIYTTKQALKEEEAIKKSAREGRGKLKPLNEGYTIKNEKLTTEQAAAVQHVLKSKDFITVVAGGAGTGKTWSIKEVQTGVRAAGRTFSAFAPSAEASRNVQRKEGFGSATTVAELLQSSKYHNQVREGVIWIDEAGMVGNKTMNRIIKLAKEQDARILLTGDIKQHNAVERGDALRIIQKYGGIKPARISKIQRQKVNEYKNAVELISNGKIGEGIKSLDSMNAIKEANDFLGLKENVANEYVKALKDREDTLIVATTHAQGLSVTDTIREKLKSEGLLSKDEKKFNVQKNLGYTEAQKKDKANYQKGMSIQFHQNVKGGIIRGEKYDVIGKDKKGNILISEKNSEIETKNKIVLPCNEANKFSVYENHEINLAKGDRVRPTQNGYSMNGQRVNNGSSLTVKDFDREGNIIATTGKREIVLAKDFGNLTHGYYTTSPASQGKSVNRVIVMQSSLSGKAASKEQFYVSASRGKFAISIHTDDKENLLASVSRSTQRMTATEVAKGNRSKIIGIKDKFKRFGAIYRAVKSRVVNFKEPGHKENTVINIRSRPEKQIAHAEPTKGR